jgi:methanogenic corrinoid protein MtbC1
MRKQSINIHEPYLKHLLAGNRQMCSSIAKQHLSENHTIKELYEDVFKVALYEVGLLWENNKISVATEHLATAITEGILNELYQNLDIQAQQNKKVVLTCVENELHQVGVKMVADVFEMNGWESYFLGTGIPINELIDFIKQIKPDVLAISMSIFFNYQNLARMIDTLKNEFPELTIILGGQAFLHKKENSFDKIHDVKYITNLYELDNYIKTI